MYKELRIHITHHTTLCVGKMRKTERGPCDNSFSIWLLGEDPCGNPRKPSAVSANRYQQGVGEVHLEFWHSARGLQRATTRFTGGRMMLRIYQYPKHHDIRCKLTFLLVDTV